MDAGLIIGLLLTVLGSLFTVLGLIWEKSKENGGRVRWQVWFPMLAALIGTGFTTWQLLEESRQDREVLASLKTTLERSNEIIVKQNRSDSLEKVAMHLQDSIGDATCRSIGESIAKLDSQSFLMQNMIREMRLTSTQNAEVLNEVYEMNWPLDSAEVTYFWNFNDSAIESNVHRSLYGLWPSRKPWEPLDLDGYYNVDLDTFSVKDPYGGWFVEHVDDYGAFYGPELLMINERNEPLFELERAFEIPMLRMSKEAGNNGFMLLADGDWVPTDDNKIVGKGSLYSLNGLKPTFKVYMPKLPVVGSGQDTIYDPWRSGMPTDLRGVIIRFYPSNYSLPLLTEFVRRQGDYCIFQADAIVNIRRMVERGSTALIDPRP
jgi:hypothetical protein